MPESLKDRANGLPLKPGVYIMMDKTGEVIYVGKAKLLKNRVSSYFHGSHEPKTEAMISKIATFDVIIVNSEFEALVLENSLIKQHMPKYNIDLRDDKGHPFIRVDLKSEYPTFTVASKRLNDGARYLGPFGRRGVTQSAIEAICKSLKLPTCGRKFPRDIGKERPCLNYHMGACLAYCRPDAPRETYLESVEAAVAILDGKTAEIIKRLTGEMEDAAEQLRFELAAEKRDRIRAVRELSNKQLVISGLRADTDVIGYFRGEAKCCFVVLHYIEGKLVHKDFELIETPIDADEDAISAILRQYYMRRGILPKAILLPEQLPDCEALEKYFSELAEYKVTIDTPSRGDKRKLVETAVLNAREETERASTREEKTRKAIEWLQRAMALDSPPLRMEAYDISNTGNEDIVASMTVYQNGKPQKSAYRRFKIKTLDGQDDYHSMREVISRRAVRFLDGDEKFAPLPDVFLIDGGATHADGAREALREHGIVRPVFGMVKDDRHRTRALVSPDGDEIGIAANPAVFALIGTIQEETHRFAVDFHHALRSKGVRGSKLDMIPGVGEKRRNALLKSFGSLRAIKEAELEELAAVVGKSVAQKVYDYFRGGEEAQAETETEARAETETDIDTDTDTEIDTEVAQ